MSFIAIYFKNATAGDIVNLKVSQIRLKQRVSSYPPPLERFEREGMKELFLVSALSEKHLY